MINRAKRKLNIITKLEYQLINIIKKAVDTTIKDQIDSLKNGQVERNFTVYLSQNISKLLDTQKVVSDPFYNKHLGATKRLDGRVIELDIAVHSRNIDVNNLVAIELETTNSPKGDDIWKIEGLTNPLGGYGYKLGLYIVFGIKKKAGKIIILQWYKNGEILILND